MIVRIRCAAFLGTLLGWSLVSTAQAAPPVVAGFERFGKTDAEAGQLLLNELNCLACHAAEKSAVSRQAPVLDNVGSRIRTSYFKTFLSDPQKAKPGSTMPHVFAGDPNAAGKIEALSHFLASTGSPTVSPSDPKSAAAGNKLYHSLGCVACHGTRTAKSEPEKTTAASVPLGDLKAKYTIASLTEFLIKPHTARPSGRMPSLLVDGDAKSKAKDAHDLACFLIQGVKRSDVPAGKGTTNYAYYEGDWENLPNFAKLKPADTGVDRAFDLRAAKRGKGYALSFEGVFRVEREGQYKFYLTSDDGSRLTIDGNVIVNNDGVHPAKTQTGATRLAAGLHKVRVDFFQGGFDAELGIAIEGSGLPKQNLADITAANEAALDKIQKPVAAKDDPDFLDSNPELVNAGKLLFASEGCANCHQMKGVTGTAKAPSLAQLKATGGCLSDAPAKGVPFFGLSANQKTALAAAISSPPAPTIDPAVVIARTLRALNCYACHSRDKIGGPEDTLNEFFLTTQKEMGDEARIPPALDNVGGKINLDYLKNILNNGSHDRPYMTTRMPAFGAQNVGPLFDALKEADKGKFVGKDVAFTEPAGKIKGIGRHMIGAKAFGCIKCHTFAGQKAEGVQGIDMTLMPARLTSEWFYQYLSDPQKIRPGTRMPSAFEKGKSLLAGVLDGSADSQIAAMWLYLKDGKAAQLPEGAKKQSIPLVPDKTAIIYRNFIQGAGPRGIGVGFPEKVNIAFDANDMRLAMLWQGSFIDAARHWEGRGVGFEGPLGDNILSLPNGAAFAHLDKADSPWPSGSAKNQDVKFRGYKTSKDDRPTFLYSVGDVTVEDFPNAQAFGKDVGIRRTIDLTSTKDAKKLYYRAAVGNKIEDIGKNTYRIDGAIRTTIDSATPPIVRTVDGKMELLVPVTFENNRAKIVQDYAW